MYESWLTPPAEAELLANPGTLGERIQRSVTNTTRIALVGVDASASRSVRKYLYGHRWDFGEIALVDLGDIRKQTPEFVIPLLRELHHAAILPIIIGADDRLLPAQYLAFGALNRQVSLFCVDQEIRLSPRVPDGKQSSVLDAALYRNRTPVYHLAHAGSQRHLSDPVLEGLFSDRHLEAYPLGRARADLDDLEPSIRDADLLTLDISALSWPEAPAQVGYNPSGFTVQEACQLCYYAGNSDRLSSIGVYGMTLGQRGEDAEQLTAATYAQLIWYFIHGYSRRKDDFPVSLTGMAEYVVATKHAEQLTFWRSPRTNRWWIQVPADHSAGEARNRLVACSYQDYLTTSQEGHLPDRIVRAFSRY